MMVYVMWCDDDVIPLQVLQEVLLSIDRAIQKIHEDAAAQNGMYTAEQRATLQWVMMM